MLAMQSERTAPAVDFLEKRRAQDFGEELRRTGWYHSIELPDGSITPGYLKLETLRERFAEFPLPADLSGKRILDIGTWDGWFAFEAERRGADVVAIDNVEQENFRWAHRALGSRVRYEIAEVYELREKRFEPFDYVLFLGVLYHLRHPLLALEMVCEATKEIAIVDSFIVEDDNSRSPIPWMEFYEGTELSNQVDNWCGPTIPCLLAMCRAAGFARAELISVKDQHARVACYRRWEPAIAEAGVEAPVVTGVANARANDYGINFRTSKEEYMTAWFRSDEAGLRREDMRPEVSGLGSPAVALNHYGGRDWHVSFALPRGLAPGWHEVRIRTARSGFSNVSRIAVDMPVVAERVELKAICDALTWRDGEVAIGADGSGYACLWIAGLAENCDRNNVRAYAGGRRLTTDFVSPGGAGSRR